MHSRTSSGSVFTLDLHLGPVPTVGVCRDTDSTTAFADMRALALLLATGRVVDNIGSPWRFDLAALSDVYDVLDFVAVLSARVVSEWSALALHSS